MAVSDIAAVRGGEASKVTPLVAYYRRRILADRRRRSLSIAALGIGVAWAAGAILFYMGLAPEATLPFCLAVTLISPIAALIAASLRQPTLDETAALLDTRLDDRQRVLTSVGLLADGIVPDPRPLSPVPQQQIETTAEILRARDPRVLVPVRTPWSILALSVGLICLALGLYVLRGAPGGFSPLQVGSVPADQDAASAFVSPTPESGLPEAERQATTTAQQREQEAQASASQTPSAEGEGAGEGSGQGDASAQAEASRQAQESLDRLSEALDEQSATQGAADSLKQGDAQGAADQLSELGEQNDQLSPQAKAGLAGSLRQASQDPATTDDLRQAESNAANALERGDYKEIERAMKELGEAIKRAAEDIVPQQDLAKNFPQNSQGNSEGSQGEQGEQSQGSEQGSQSEGGQQSQGNESGQGQGQGEQGSSGGEGGEEGQNGARGGEEGQGNEGGGGSENAEGEGEAGGPGQGSRVSGPADQPDLDVEGNPFELEGRPDPSGRPSDQQERPGLTLDAGSGGGSSSSPAQPGGVGNAQGESNRLPLDRWGIIQRYFGGKE